MPSNSVEDSVLCLAELKMNPGETIASYALYFQSECTRFEACVQRVTPRRSPYAALPVVLFRNCVVPGIRLLASQEQHPRQCLKLLLSSVALRPRTSLALTLVAPMLTSVPRCSLPSRTAPLSPSSMMQSRCGLRPALQAPAPGIRLRRVWLGRGQGQVL